MKNTRVALLSFILNLPWTFEGFIAAILSIPKGVKFYNNPLAIIFNVKSFWWYTWKLSKKGTRAMTQGHIILLGPSIEPNDLAHELIHVRQYIQAPFIHKFLYNYQSIRFGYRQNKFEQEAYTKSGSSYHTLK